jgi:hypothetical protein
VLNGSANDKLITDVFLHVDANKNGSLDVTELQVFVIQAFDVMAKRKELVDSKIPSMHGSAVPILDWPVLHSTIRSDVAKEVTTALLKVVDKNHDGKITLDEFLAFDWTSMIPSVESAMHEEKERQKLTRVGVSAPKIVVTALVVRQVDFSRTAVGRLTAEELATRLAVVGEPENVEMLNISGHSLLHGLTKEMLAPFNRLTHLIAIDSELKSLPELPHSLMVLELGKNRLRTVPAHISDLIHLEKLDVESNILRSLPFELGTLSKLHYVDFRYNGELPSSIAVMFSDKGSTQHLLASISKGDARGDDDVLEGSGDESGLRDTVSDLRHAADGQDVVAMQQMGVLGLILGKEEVEKMSPALTRNDRE